MVLKQLIMKDHKVITLSYINIDEVVQYLLKDNKDVIILCSGWKGFFNLEDPIFAGTLSNILLDSNKFNSECDSLFISVELMKNEIIYLNIYLNHLTEKRLKSLNMEEN